MTRAYGNLSTKRLCGIHLRVIAYKTTQGEYKHHTIAITTTPPWDKWLHLSVSFHLMEPLFLPSHGLPIWLPLSGGYTYMFCFNTWWSSCMYAGNTMTSSNGNNFCVTGFPVRGIHRSPVNSPHKGQWHGVWCFLWSAPEQTVELTIVRLVIWGAISLIMTSL